MTKDDIIVLLLVMMFVAVALELAYIFFRRRRRKQEMSMFKRSSAAVETMADKAYNVIMTTESIASTLARQGIDTREADMLLRQARQLESSKDFGAAIERAESAKLVLLRLKRESAARTQPSGPPHPDPGMRPMDRSVYDAPEQPKPAEEVDLNSLPANYVQAKFMLASTKDHLDKKGVTRGEAYDLYREAINFYDNKEYSKALSYAIKADRMLDSGTLELIAEEKVECRAEEEIVEVLVCPNCESEISEDDAFCRECGTGLEEPGCPGCGETVSSNDKFCRKCGQKL